MNQRSQSQPDDSPQAAPRRRSRSSSLIDRILALQLVIAGSMGVAALAILTWVFQDLTGFSWTADALIRWLAAGALLLTLVLGLLWASGRYLLREALSPLSGLQQPLLELARGNTSVDFQSSRHVEIQDVIDALRCATEALGERDRHLSHLATHDSLTGLRNRHGFVQQLTREIERLAVTDKQSAVLFIDLDQFKYINDNCGHLAGDELLRSAAHSIRTMTRDGDCVARFGGDEFAVLVRDVSRAQARTVGNKILRQMRLLTHIHKENVYRLRCSIGITMLGDSTLDVHEFLAQADTACHTAKAGGRNRLEFYTTTREEVQQLANRIGWAEKIRTAFETDDFVLVYQPVLGIRGKRKDTHEVLLRLRVDDSLVSPDVFLPAATRFGLMADIDHWVLEAAIRRLSAYRDPRASLNFSINLSASVIDDENFVQRVESTLGRYEMPPESITFEVSEQTAVKFAAQSRQQLSLLRDLGCRIAIDDFGKAYSSFSYLRDIPVDYLKIDGSFIEDLANNEMNQTLVRAMGDIARAAQMETMAKNVDGAETLAILADLGIDYAQGHYIGEPDSEPADFRIRQPGETDSAKRVTSLRAAKPGGMTVAR